QREARRQAEAARKAEEERRVAAEQRRAAQREAGIKGLRGGDGLPSQEPERSGIASTQQHQSTATADSFTEDHVMPEGWRRFAQLYATSPHNRAQDAQGGEADRSSMGSQPVPVVMANRTRAGEDACPGAGRRITPPGTYVVRTGDSLWLISRRHYRKGALWPIIQRANDAKIADPDLIFPCQRFEIPLVRRR
ncbi:MAG TPA: LysM peptidoglycan-binding domain-containing protein, partial [Hyphomicrobiaceae bacterium]|nr:LysM peptidoglycan-binding domain-containing protein [Hyphomicrobiaceae bacterium]